MIVLGKMWALAHRTLDTHELDPDTAKRIRKAIDCLVQLHTESAAEIWEEWVDPCEESKLLSGDSVLALAECSIDNVHWCARGPLKDALVEGLVAKLTEYIDEHRSELVAELEGE